MDRQQILSRYFERRTMLVQLFSSIRQRPLLCLGFTLYWIWINLAFQSPLLYPLVRVFSNLTVPSIGGPIAASILVYFVLGMWFKRSNRVFGQRWYPSALISLIALGIGAHALWLEWAWPTSFLDAHVVAEQPGVVTVGGIALYVASSLCVGTATSCLCIEWGRIFGELGPRQVLFHGIIAFLGASLVTTFISQFPPFVRLLASLAILVPMALCINRSQREFPRKPFFDHGLDARLSIPGKFLFTALLYGLSFGVLIGLFSVHGYENSATTLISHVAAAVFLVVAAIAVMMDFNHLIYQIGFSLVALGSALIAFFYPAFQVGGSIQLMGFCYLHLLLWGLCSYFIKTFKLPATWVVAWPTCSFMFGKLTGIVVSTVTAHLPSPAHGFERLFLALAVIMLLGALFLMSYRNYQTAWGLARPGFREPRENDIAAVVQLLATTNELSHRETQTFEFLVRGKNRRAIAQALFISEETVKSHTHSIYRKLIVHSQQELIELCESNMRRFDTSQSSPFEENRDS
jgi:DNA-binding CsgD family transcriptional regulator